MPQSPKGWIQDSTSNLDYTFDWSKWLEFGETISSHEITISPDNHSNQLSSPGSTSTDDKVTVWITGGRKNVKYAVKCRITTTESRTETASFLMKVGSS